MRKRPFPYNELSSLAAQSFTFSSIDAAIYGKWHENHESVSYATNSDGFRWNNFVDAETVILGCSTTFGVGLPLDRTWPYLLSDKTGATNVIAVPGGSIPQIIDIGVAVMSKFRAPKRILFLTPNLERVHISFIPNINVDSTYNWDFDINEFISMRSPKIEPLQIRSFDKNYRSIPLEYAVGESFRSLIRLGLLAKTIGADFHFFSWIDDVNEIFELALIPGFLSGGKVEPFGPCHENERGREFWDHAIDRGRHPGEHHHTHYKNRFELIFRDS